MNPRSSTLSSTQLAVLRSVSYHTQMTASQVRRLHYAGTPEGVRIRSQRHLKKLTDLKLLKRMWGVYPITGTAQYIYKPAERTAEGPIQHTLDITELFVRLNELANVYLSTNYTNAIHILAFDREPWCHVQIGHMTLKPDAFCRVRTAGGVFQIFYECDRGTEHRAQLAKQMRAYVHAFEQWDIEVDGPVFPQVLWTTPTLERKRVVESVVKRLSYPQLFTVRLFDDAPTHIMGK